MHQRHSKTWSPSFLMPRTRRDGALNPCPRESRWGVPARKRPAGPQSIGLWSRTNLRPATSHGALAPVVVDSILAEEFGIEDAGDDEAEGE